VACRGLKHARNRFVLVVTGSAPNDGAVARHDPASSDMGWIDPDLPDADDLVEMRGGRWRGWHILGLVAAVLAAGTSLVIRNNADHPKNAARQPAAPFQSVTPNPPVPAVQTTTLGGPLLRVPESWELFARGPGVMVRVQLAAGAITRTFVSQPYSRGVSFVVGPDRAIIRPLDSVPGYEVRDGKSAHDLSGVFGSGGVALPGPDRGHLWVETGAGRSASMTLVGFDGRRTRTAIPIPLGPRDVDFASADGAGYLLFRLTGGVYRATPDGLLRVTAGHVLAAGPTRWLTLECDARQHCTPTVIDRATGHRHILPASMSRYLPGGGVISPDGRTAALFRAEIFTGDLAVHLIDLATGADRATGVTLTPPSDTLDPQGPLVWSPDSRWLFAADSREQLTVIDKRTDRVHFLGVGVTGVRQVAFRTAS
jgi:hypothetical protein